MHVSPVEVLIIDDSAEDRETIRCFLQAAPDRRYRIREADTAAEGARALQLSQPQCVLLDYRLPDSNGLFLLKEYTHQTTGFNCPVVLMTGSADMSISTAALQQGAQDFLAKQEMTTPMLERTIQHAIVRFRLLQERESARQALSERENLLRMAQEIAGIGTWELDLLTGETRFGGAYFELFGLPPDHPPFSFDNWLERVHPDDRPRVQAENERAIDSNTDFNYEYRAVWPDGTPHWLLARGAVVRDKSGTPRQLVGVNMDVTASKTAEAALVAANKELENFAFTAGHDLQAPLRSMGVFVALLDRSLGSDTDPKIRDAIGFIRSGSQKLSSLIADLLEFAQSGSRAVTETVPLQSLLQRATENLASDIQASGATITWENLPPDACFSDELVRVFQNLIGNAILYSRPGIPPSIRVVGTRNSGDWLIAVKDNGQGFDISLHDLIFQPFKRLRSHDQPGTGLGLPICKRIIEKAGGRIWAESEPGVGTTFLFTLPIMEMKLTAEPVRRSTTGKTVCA